MERDTKDKTASQGKTGRAAPGKKAGRSEASNATTARCAPAQEVMEGLEF
jgi:hypothetical protein